MNLLSVKYVKNLLVFLTLLYGVYFQPTVVVSNEKQCKLLKMSQFLSFTIIANVLHIEILLHQKIHKDDNRQIQDTKL